MAHEFTEEQIEEFKDAFELFDKTGEGMIKYGECVNLARCFGYNPSEYSVLLLLCGGDEENLPSKEDMATKSLSFDDYLPILWAISNSTDPGSYEDFLEGLKVFDKDGNGTVNSAELRHVLTSLGEKLTSAQFDQLTEGMEGPNGAINIEEFIKKMMSDSDEVEPAAE
ncbi:Oidioi.mRNA.OKI2018_I69.chr1.g352.t1.cds [Oikopleura dioica]|uniref:Oidioi.mRNA.OKI2018_I69.chr1.g352.t1.cds n=1 Tax=Oikopleura dioica TaxID=34765 RepID=A0ABN7SNB0_OIKDI|nr:Oidioi.mRNA.OKI2018_I69.chr1.g352.t1.cds [Oikopleura dioica]